MKKVLIFSLNYYPRFIGGAEVAIKEITDRTPDIEFHMITLRFDSTLPKVEKIGNVLVHRIGFTSQEPGINDLKKFPLHLNKVYYQFAAAWKAEALTREYRYDGIWAMMAHSCAVPAGIFKSKHPEVPYLLTLQEGDPPEAIEHTMRPVYGLFKEGFVRADYMQTISTFLLAWGRRMGFVGDGQVVPNGVNVARFAQTFSPEERAASRKKLDKKEGDIFLVTTSRLVPKNGIDDVIRALPFLPEQVSFLIYGIGPDEAKLRSLAKELKVEERVRFMGEIAHVDMPLMLTACDIFIRPSRSEGMGNSFVEAMAAGIPVIATQEGGLSDFIFDAKRNPDKPATAWAVGKDAPEEIAEAVTDMLAHPQQVRTVVAIAKAMVVEKYDWNLIAGAMKALFDRMLVGAVK